jgi:transposase
MIKKQNETKRWREERRERAWKLKQAGWKQSDIAEALGVTKGAVSIWIKRAKEGGEEALKIRYSPGAPRRLKNEQRKQLLEVLEKGAEEYGFRGEVWTNARIAKVIKREYGVSYHPAHVSKIMKKLGWSPQKPIRRAQQQKEAEIERWKTEKWPKLKKKP